MWLIQVSGLKSQIFAISGLVWSGRAPFAPFASRAILN